MKQVNAYLNFDGNCRQAMKFYQKCLGAELELTTFGQMPGMPYKPGSNISIAIQCDSLVEIERVFTALSENGSVTMPLSETPWAARFGMLRDQFGIHWMLNLSKPPQG